MEYNEGGNANCLRRDWPKVTLWWRGVESFATLALMIQLERRGRGRVNASLGHQQLPISLVLV